MSVTSKSIARANRFLDPSQRNLSQMTRLNVQVRVFESFSVTDTFFTGEFKFVLDLRKIESMVDSIVDDTIDFVDTLSSR